MNVIETHELARFPAGRGPTHVLSDVSIAIPEGARVGLLGGNGAGKSTFIKLLLGLAPIGRGEARIFDHPVPTEESRKSLGYLPEQAAPLDYLTGSEHLRLFGRLEGLGGADLAETVEKALADAGLASAADLITRRYSKGMRQRLELARVMMTPKRLLILDEPLTGLDAESQIALEDRLLALIQEGVSMVITSHEPHLLEAICDHYATLKRGRLVRFGPAKEILEQRGWTIEVAPNAPMPDPLPPGAERLEKRHCLLFADQEQARTALKDLLAAKVAVTGFGTLLKTVADVLREVVIDG